MKEIVADSSLIARCGLYCGACGAYRKGRCPGCKDNIKASWCKIRSCCNQHGYTNCAECQEFKDPNDCRTFNSIVGKVFGLIFNSNRQACILKIRELGPDKFAVHMTHLGRQSLPRR